MSATTPTIPDTKSGSERNTHVRPIPSFSVKMNIAEQRIKLFKRAQAKRFPIQVSFKFDESKINKELQVLLEPENAEQSFQTAVNKLQITEPYVKPKQYLHRDAIVSMSDAIVSTSVESDREGNDLAVVSMWTQDCFLETTSLEFDADELYKLYGDTRVRKTVADGKTLDEDAVNKRFTNWRTRQKLGSHLTPLSVYWRRNDGPFANGEFLGISVFANGDLSSDDPRIQNGGEVSWMFHVKCWSEQNPKVKYVATQCVDALVNDLGRVLCARGEKLYLGQQDSEKHSLERPLLWSFATAHPDNRGSWSAMEKVGMKPEMELSLMDLGQKKTFSTTYGPRFRYFKSLF